VHLESNKESPRQPENKFTPHKQFLVFVCGRASGQTSLLSVTQSGSTFFQANAFLQKNQSKGKKEQVSSLKKLLI